MHQFMAKASLVLEGGGLRGVYTSGVLRLFADKGLAFSSVIGVSMGACNGVNFVAEQFERSRMSNIRYARDPRYLSYSRWLRGGELFGMDFLFGALPLKLIPFDFEMFRNSPSKFWFTVTNCLTGRAMHVEKGELGRKDFKSEAMAVLRASCSLPIISHPVDLGGVPFMDGGLSDPIPIEKSLELGSPKHLIILTQPPEYRKSPTRFAGLCKLRHPDLPGLFRVLKTRHERYNRSLEQVRELERKGEALVLRPKEKLRAGRLCRNQAVLYEVYDQGYYDALAMLPAIKDFLAIS